MTIVAWKKKVRLTHLNFKKETLLDHLEKNKYNVLHTKNENYHHTLQEKHYTKYLNDKYQQLIYTCFIPTVFGKNLTILYHICTFIRNSFHGDKGLWVAGEFQVAVNLLLFSKHVLFPHPLCVTKMGTLGSQVNSPNFASLMPAGPALFCSLVVFALTEEWHDLP